jgi:hypothetical protein
MEQTSPLQRIKFKQSPVILFGIDVKMDTGIIHRNLLYPSGIFLEERPGAAVAFKKIQAPEGFTAEKYRVAALSAIDRQYDRTW